MHYFEKIIVRFAGRWGLRFYTLIASGGWGTCPQTPDLSFKCL